MSLTSYRTAPPRVKATQTIVGALQHRPSIDEEEVRPFLAGLATTYSPMS
jgi:hypothetical protein